MAEETRAQRLARLGLGPATGDMFTGGGAVVQGQSVDHLASVREKELAELAALRAKRARSPGGLLSGTEMDRLSWLERWHGKE